MSKTRRIQSVVIHNPKLLSDDELRASFIARTHLLERLVEDVRDADEHGRQHHLITGARGMGKTTLLLRIALAVEDDTEAADHWIPLRFPEEQYNVQTLKDFYLNVLDALSDYLEKHGHEEESERLDDLIDQSGPLQEIFELLQTEAARLKRGFVLLVDNFDMVLNALSEKERWRFRDEVLGGTLFLLIGASSNRESTSLYQDAFWEGITEHWLRPLTFEETKDTLLHLADSLDRSEVRTRIEAEPGRLRSLSVFTAGNPRTLAMLFRIYDEAGDVDTRAMLERLLDEHSAYYKHRFEELADAQQLIFNAVALHWHPITSAEITAALNQSLDEDSYYPSKVSAQLNKMLRAGVVEKVKVRERSKADYYQIAERFFNTWYLMRASRRMRRQMLWLAEFLKAMYSPPEIEQLWSAHLQQDLPVDESALNRFLETYYAFGQALPDSRRKTGHDVELEEKLIDVAIQDSGMMRSIQSVAIDPTHRETIMTAIRARGKMMSDTGIRYAYVASISMILTGDVEGAKSTLREGLVSAPEHHELLYCLAMIHFCEGELGPAKVLAIKAYKKAPVTMIGTLLARILIRAEELEGINAILKAWAEGLKDIDVSNPYFDDFYCDLLGSNLLHPLLRLFRETKKDREFRPLYEALRALESGTEDSLRELAPEIRQPAREILERIKEGG